MKRLLRSISLALLAGGLAAARGPARADAQTVGSAVAARATEKILDLDYPAAHALLDAAGGETADVAVARARLALYEEECDLAAALLAEPDVARAAAGEPLAEVARGCARVTASTLVHRDDAARVIVRFQDEHDSALADLVVGTVVQAREALTRDLGVAWPAPLRVTVVRDLLSLSAMTGLPYESAKTTGTVAVAKWGRVTLLSPRAARHGYPVQDTLAHELTHLAIARATLDRAPLWLHEGLAKREEVRWRPPSPQDDRPTPEAIVLRGMELKLDLPLDKLGPSIAMLPSADAAMVAFAEVASFVRLLAELRPTLLAELLAALRVAPTVDEALVRVTGEGLAQWDARWRQGLAKRPKETLPPLFGLGKPPKHLGELRDKTRLTELLLGAGLASAAARELARAPDAAKLGADPFADPALAHLRARVLEAEGKLPEGLLSVEDPRAVLGPYGPWWATRGRLAASAGRPELVEPSFAEAVAHDPLGVEAACGSLDPAARTRPGPLCVAASSYPPGLD